MTTTNTLHVGHGMHEGALSLFPVWIDGPAVAGVSWNAGRLQVDEQENGPTVGHLTVTNSAPRPVVVLEGDLLEGGWQNRMLAQSAVIAGGERRRVDVVCVEKGRWGGDSGHSARGRKAALRVRHGSVSRGSDDRQGEVWRRVGRYERELGSTPTSSMVEHLDRAQGSALRLIEGQRGVVIGIGGAIVGAELFGSSEALASRWQGAVDAARLDARLAPVTRTTSADARRFIRKLEAMSLERGDAEGTAQRLASRHEQLTLSGLALASPGQGLFEDAVGRMFAELDAVLHLAVFNEAHPLLAQD